MGSTRGGHANRGGHSHLSHRASVTSPSNPETLGPNKALAITDVSCRHEETPSVTFLDSLGLESHSATAPPTISSPLLGKMENRPLASPKPKLLTIIPNEQHPAEPHLISSNLTPIHVPRPNPVDRHLELVDKVVQMISSVENLEEDKEELTSNDSGTFQDPDNDMILAWYQPDAKIKELASRETEKSGSKVKKWRKT